MKTEIVNHAQVQKIIRRMAYQIYEHNFELKELIIASINGQGNEVAKLLEEELKTISKIKINSVTILLDKKAHSTEGVQLSEPGIKLQDKTILLVDDVLNTGRTLIYGMMPFLHSKVKSLQVAVLVDRNHKSFPVAADYKGLSLQTTLQEHVSVIFKNHKINIYLE
ncbi:MAG: phosphoribosyltransferase family protein [Bacteroidota bacterium]|nr:phosphoribosyltransferase family protein [Bacteroidota bacterium]